jgi:C4-dicarboxylate-specific signal transduction histidine kinase
MTNLVILWLGPFSTLTLPLRTATLTKWYVVAATLLIVLGQMTLIGALLAQRARRRRSEEALRHSEARNLAFRSAIPDLMFLLSRDGVYLDYHARDKGDLFLKPEIFLGRPMWDVLPPDLAADFGRAFDRTVRTGAPQELEYALTMNGERRFFEARVVGCDDDKLLAIVREITARKRAEAQLEEAHEDVVRLARITAMGELTASIAHEVNQPLCAIVTNASACLNWLQSEASRPDIQAKVRTALQDIVGDAKRAGDVAHRTRSLFANTHGERKPIDLNHVIHEGLRLVRGRVEQSSVDVVLDLAPNLAPVVADYVQLEQVLLNLFLNALDEMSGDHKGRRTLGIRTTQDGSFVAIEVSDTGRGLGAADLNRIFTPFYTTKPDGIGMGLAVSRTIVQSHGGALSAESNSGGGATFKVALPASNAIGTDQGRPAPVGVAARAARTRTLRRH